MDEESNAALAILMSLGLGLIVFAATLIMVWRKRNSRLVRRAARFGFIASLVVGCVGLVHWSFLGNEPLLPFAPISIPVAYMAPAFIVGYYLSLGGLWYRDKTGTW